MFIGVVQSSIKFMSGGSGQAVDDVSINQTSLGVLVSFSVNVSEYNQRPTIDYVAISGTTINGSTLTAVISDFFSPGSYPEGTHLYQWYRSNTKQLLGTAISGATSSSYLLNGSDVAKFIRCVVTPVQTGGINDEGNPVTSIYTDAISDNVFNPVTDISWFTAHRPSGSVDISTTEYWLNEGAFGGSNSVRNGSDPMPSYNGTQGALEFTNASSTELVLDLPNPQYSMPVEIWVRAKLKTQIPSWQRLMSFSTDHLIEIRNTGGLFLSGGSTGYTFPTNQWKVLRFVISGTTNTSKLNVNNGAVINNAVPAVTFAIGVNNGRIGANNSGTGTFADAYISHVFVKSGELTSGQQADMWDWFNDNAPWD